MTIALSHPRLVLLEDWHTFELLEPWVYRWEHEGEVRELTVPAGTVTDLASVPKLLRWWIEPSDLRQASIAHDLIYRCAGWVPSAYYIIGGKPCEERWTRRDADLLFARIMRESGVGIIARRNAYRGVRLAGWLIWRQHERAMQVARAAHEGVRP